MESSVLKDPLPGYAGARALESRIPKVLLIA
jgi:hypothetical protein